VPVQALVRLRLTYLNITPEGVALYAGDNQGPMEAGAGGVGKNSEITSLTDHHTSPTPPCGIRPDPPPPQTARSLTPQTRTLHLATIAGGAAHAGRRMARRARETARGGGDRGYLVGRGGGAGMTSCPTSSAVVLSPADLAATARPFPPIRWCSLVVMRSVVFSCSVHRREHRPRPLAGLLTALRPSWSVESPGRLRAQYGRSGGGVFAGIPLEEKSRHSAIFTLAIVYVVTYKGIGEENTTTTRRTKP